MCVKDHRDSFSQLLKKKDLISIKIFFVFYWCLSQFYNEFKHDNYTQWQQERNKRRTNVFHNSQRVKEKRKRVRD